MPARVADSVHRFCAVSSIWGREKECVEYCLYGPTHLRDLLFANFMLFLSCVFLQLIYEPRNALSKIKCMTNINNLLVSPPGYHPRGAFLVKGIRLACWNCITLIWKTPWGWHPGAETCRRLFDVHVTVNRDKFLIIKPTRCTNFSNLFLQWNSTCFGQFLCPSSGV